MHLAHINVHASCMHSAPQCDAAHGVDVHICVAEVLDFTSAFEVIGCDWLKKA
jgi:hypothetical protein